MYTTQYIHQYNACLLCAVGKTVIGLLGQLKEKSETSIRLSINASTAYNNNNNNRAIDFHFQYSLTPNICLKCLMSFGGRTLTWPTTLDRLISRLFSIACDLIEPPFFTP